MDKRYQFFVSSTFRDLGPERAAIINAVLELHQMPFGMEMFPAANQTPWNIIEKVIDLSDFFVLVLAGKYGSVTEEGISFTEKEYDYAVSSDIPVLAFLRDQENIPGKHLEEDSELRRKLNAFRSKVMDAHTIQKWDKPDELKSQVIVALVHEMGTSDAVGWVRGGQLASEESLQRIDTLQDRVAELEATNRELESQTGSSKFGTGLRFDVDAAADSLPASMADYMLYLSCERNIGNVRIDQVTKSKNREVAELYEHVMECVSLGWLRLDEVDQIIVFTTDGWKIVDALRRDEVIRFIKLQNQDTTPTASDKMIQSHLDTSLEETRRLLTCMKGFVSQNSDSLYYLTVVGSVAFGRLDKKDVVL